VSAKLYNLIQPSLLHDVKGENRAGVSHTQDRSGILRDYPYSNLEYIYIYIKIIYFFILFIYLSYLSLIGRI